MAKIDLHLHSRYSKRSSEWLFRRFGIPASMSDPHALYKKLSQGGIDFFTLTDYNSIEGCLEIADLEGVFLSEQVTAAFPEDGCHVTLLVWNINEEQHCMIQELKENIYELQCYLAQEEIAHGVAAPAVGLIDQLQPHHFMKLALLFRHIEGRNGRRSELFNEVAQFFFTLTSADIERFAAQTGVIPTHPEPWKKCFFGGSDDHSGRMMGSVYTMIPEATTIDDFFQQFRQGHGVAYGNDGTSLSMALDTYQVAFSFGQERLQGKSDNLGLKLVEKAFERFMEGRDPTVFSPGEKWRFLMQGVMSGKIFELARSGNRSLWKELASSLSTSSIKVELAKQIEGSDDPSRRAFGVANLLASRLAYRFVIQFLTQLKEGRFMESLQTVGPVIPLLAMLSPYFYAFHRVPLQRLREAAKALRGHLPASLSHRRCAWFTDTLDDINGVSTTIQKMASAATALGYDLTVMVSREEIMPLDIPFKNFDPVGTFELPEYELQRLSFPPLLLMIDYLEREKVSEVIISTPGPVGLAALGAAKILGLPTIGIYHTDFPQYVRMLTEDGFMETLTWNYMHWFYSQMDLIYVNSEHYRRCWIDRGISRERVRILPRGLDTVLFHPEKRDLHFWKKRGLQPGEIGALYVGRISREKNLDLLAAAFRRLLARGVKVRPLFVGHGPYLSTMRELLPEAIFAGSLQGEELATAYASADLFVFPSTTDTFGNVVIEAQASGLPTIVSDAGGPKDLVGHEQDGLITKALDLEALIQAMQRLIEDEALRTRWSLAARQRVSERNWERAAAEFWEELNEIFQGSSAVATYQSIFDQYH